MTSRLIIRNVTVIDGTGADPQPASAITVGSDGRIAAVSREDPAAPPPPGAEVFDGGGRYAIPGLMDGNVHLVAARTPDTLLEFEGRYEQLVREAAELTLKYGVTTVFDSWGPAGPLTRVRDAISRGEVNGSRILCAGNIIGLSGPLSGDFVAPGAFLERAAVERINWEWERGVGADLGFMTAAQVSEAVSAYIEETGVDFIKWAATDHIAGSRMQYHVFSELVQGTIAETARSHGRPIQAHTTTVDSLRISVDLEVDLLQHGDLTYGRAIPGELLDRIAEKDLITGGRFITRRHMEWTEKSAAFAGRREMRRISEANQGGLLARNARIAMATDGFAYGPRVWNHPGFRAGTLSPEVPDQPVQLGCGHLPWIAGAFERGMGPMEVLRSLTSHPAEAYGIAEEVGTLEVGKVADVVLLDRNPLEDHTAYADVSEVFKEGRLIDRKALAIDMELGEDIRSVRGRG
ncbi:amidohydrolase family protein [Brevibacterium album]|uniref:amidohydrolase family protein n=1 Tax=Brevibacterium album TaxID=417948 RepID=UPI0004902D8E|nr:amidohydrolase family protein [Brevibacterium album]